jgi:nucleoside phosphorylase
VTVAIQPIQTGQEPRRKVLIVTALPLELAAVRDHPAGLQVLKMDNFGTEYHVGTFISDEGDQWETAVVCSGPGNAEAALATTLAVLAFTPEYVLFVGVGGSLRDPRKTEVALGDVVVGSHLYPMTGKIYPMTRKSAT